MWRRCHVSYITQECPTDIGQFPRSERRDYSNGHTPLTVMPIYDKIMIIKKINSSSSKTRTAQIMILSLVAMAGLEKCCITSAYLQWLFHSGERAVTHGSLVVLNSKN